MKDMLYQPRVYPFAFQILHLLQCSNLIATSNLRHFILNLLLLSVLVTTLFVSLVQRCQDFFKEN